MKASLKIALCGVAAALGLILMFLTSIIPFGTYAFPCIAGILTVVIVIEVGWGYALGVFAVTGALSFLLVTDKEAALMYLIFLGYYPIIKSFIERIRLKWLQFVVKLVIFNACMIGAFFIAVNLLSVPAESFTVFGLYLPWLFLLAGNVIFIIYDICVTRLVTIFLTKWHKKFKKNTKL